MQNYTYFELFLKTFLKCIFRALFEILQYPSPPLKQKVLPPPAGNIQIPPPAGPFSTPLLPPTTVPKYENKLPFMGITCEFCHAAYLLALSSALSSSTVLSRAQSLALHLGNRKNLETIFSERKKSKSIRNFT